MTVNKEVGNDTQQKARQHWGSLMKRIGNTKPRSPENLYQNILKKYSEPHRVHYTLEHVVSMLDELNTIPPELYENKETIEIAIWWHKSMYEVGSPDRPHVDSNEKYSATIGRVTCRQLGKSTASWTSKVEGMILCTKHEALPKTNDERIISDLYHAILGKSPEEFARYENAIRKEYAWMKDAQYKKVRIATLRELLNKEHMYHTELFRNKYKAQAIKNLQKSIKLLSA